MTLYFICAELSMMIVKGKMLFHMFLSGSKCNISMLFTKRMQKTYKNNIFILIDKRISVVISLRAIENVSKKVGCLEL